MIRLSLALLVFCLPLFTVSFSADATHQPVQKRTFPGIGAANQRDVTSAKVRGRITFLRIHLQFENVVCLP